MKSVKLTAAALLVGGLAGCANMDDQSRTKAEGAGVGALIGGVVGYAIGGDRGAIIGAAAGAGLGYAVGNEVAKRKKEYASTEDFLDGEIARTQEFNSTALAYNQKLGKEIAALEKESQTLRASYDKGSAKKSALTAKRNDLQKRIADSKKLEDTLAREHEIQTAILDEQRQTRPVGDPYVTRLEKEVQGLQDNLDKLREGSTQLARIDQRLSV